MSQMKGNSMVLKAKNRNRVVVTPPDQAPATLRDVHDRASGPRRQSALRRLETLLGVPLEGLPADIDRFDACFPTSGLGGPDMPWTSERAYRHWRTTVRNAIRRHLESVMIAYAQAHLLQLCDLSLMKEQYQSSCPPDRPVRHDDIDHLVAHSAHFRKTASDPTSD
jgi:hypothetical protein